MKKRKKIVVDTNIWISYFIWKSFPELHGNSLSTDFQIVFSVELLDEVRKVLERPKFQRHFFRVELDEFLFTLAADSNFIEVKSEVTLCRDPNDNYLLALALDSEASFLVTGDKVLLVLKKIGNTQIISFKDFRKHLQ